MALMDGSVLHSRTFTTNLFAVDDRAISGVLLQGSTVVREHILFGSEILTSISPSQTSLKEVLTKIMTADEQIPKRPRADSGCPTFPSEKS